MVLFEKIGDNPDSPLKNPSVSEKHRYAKTIVRERRVVDIFFENFSISDPDHGSIAPILNAISLLIQKPVIISLVGVKNYIGNDESKSKNRDEPFCKLLTHSIKPNYKKVSFKKQKIRNKFYNYTDFYRDSYGEFYYTLWKEIELQFKCNVKVFPDLDLEKIRDKKSDKSIKTNTFGNYYELPCSSDQKFCISVDGKNSKKSLLFDQLFVIFNFVQIHSDKDMRAVPYQFLPLNSEDSASIGRVFDIVINDLRFGSAILENFLNNISDVDRKAHISHINDNDQYTSANWLDEPLKNVVNDLFDDFQHSIILHSEAFEADSTKPKQKGLPNFLLAVRVPTSGNNNAVRLILSDQQLYLIKEILTEECLGFNITRAEEILNLAQVPIDYERTIEYRALPFQENIGFWNLRNNRVNELNINEQKAYRARRIIYAIVWGARGYDEDGLIKFGDELGITVFPFHFVGSPFAHIIHVTTSFQNINKEEDNFIRWEKNTLVYSGFLRTFSRKFRARLRTSILRQCYVRTLKSFDWAQEVNARLNSSELAPKIERLNNELERFALTYPIKCYSLTSKDAETDKKSQTGEVESEELVSNNSVEGGKIEPESIGSMFLGKWGQESIYITCCDNNKFFRNYIKHEMIYSKRIAREISSAITSSRKNWSETIDIAERAFISQCSYSFVDCNLIFLISETGKFLNHSSWDIAHDFCSRFNPALIPKPFQNLAAVVAEFDLSQTGQEIKKVVSLSSYARHKEKTNPWIVSSGLDEKHSNGELKECITKVLVFLRKNSCAGKAKWPKVFLVNQREFSIWDTILRGNGKRPITSPDGVTYYSTDGFDAKHAGALDLDIVLPNYRRKILSGNEDG